MNYDVFLDCQNEVRGVVPEPKVDICIKTNDGQAIFSWNEFDALISSQPQFVKKSE